MYTVYLLTNDTNVALYTGVTNDLYRRVYEHRQHLDPKSVPRGITFTSWFIMKLVQTFTMPLSGKADQELEQETKKQIGGKYES